MYATEPISNNFSDNEQGWTVETIESFLNAPGDRPPRKGETGVFSDWLCFHRLNGKGNALQFVEKRVSVLRGEKERECIEISVAPDAYTVECRGRDSVMTYESQPCVRFPRERSWNGEGARAILRSTSAAFPLWISTFSKQP
jgi:hypothetical protein